jgi:hypothetical protein
MAASSLAGSRLKVSGSTSTNTGVAPTHGTTSGVAAKVKDGQNTASPGAHAPGHQRQGDGVGAVGAGQGQLGLAERRQLGLELAHLRTHHIGAAVEDGGDRASILSRIRRCCAARSMKDMLMGGALRGGSARVRAN